MCIQSNTSFNSRDILQPQNCVENGANGKWGHFV